MSQIQSLPCTIFDHVVWYVQAADGTSRRAEILLGECVPLFTSLDSLYAFLDGCEDREAAGLRPAVFSRSRKQFGQRARGAARDGVIGALFDPSPGCGSAPFLRFAKAAS